MNGLDLRPLSLGEILDRTFSLYRRHFVLFLGISAIPHLITLAFGLLQVFFIPTPNIIRTSGPVQISGMGLSVLLGLISALINLFVYLWSQTATVSAVTDLYLGRRTSLSYALTNAWARLAPLLGVILLNTLAMMAGALLLIIPGIYIACRLLVSVPSAWVERLGPSDSLSRSWKLTRDYAGRAFILCLVYIVLIIGISLLLETPLTLLIAQARDQPGILRLWMSSQQVLSILLDSLVNPFILIATTLFYFDLRVRKEAFDLQFMMDPTSAHLSRGDDSVSSITA